MGAQRCIEIGTFTGYSALSVALALPPDGRLVACDVNAETTAMGRRYWQEAGVAEKIDLRLGPAVETLNAMIEAGQANGYDFVFIDADKPSYDDYYECALRLLRPGGLIAIDNVLWGGRVADDLASDAETQAIQALNRKVAADPRVFCSLVPIGDGLMFAYKQGNYDS